MHFNKNSDGWKGSRRRGRGGVDKGTKSAGKSEMEIKKVNEEGENETQGHRVLQGGKSARQGEKYSGVLKRST